MLEFPRWKYVLVGVVTLLALVFAAPNFFGEDVAVQVVRGDRAAIDDTALRNIEETVASRGVTIQRAFVDEGRAMLLFDDVTQQLAARDAVNEALSADYDSALSRAPRAPEIFRNLGLRPMPLGLDLRGGLYLLYQVDVNGAISQLIDAYEQDYRRALAGAQINFSDTVPLEEDGIRSGVRVTFAAGADLDAARNVLEDVVPDALYVQSGGASPYIDATLTGAQIEERQRNAIQQNIVTLRTRVEELGVSEPQVQQQGIDRISVQLPGVTNSAEVKDILGKVATLEFRLTDTVNSPLEAAQRGRAPLGTRLEYMREVNGYREPILVKRDLIATGDQLVDATTVMTQEGPGVSVRLNAQAGEVMTRVSQQNINKPMAIILQEQTRETYTENGEVKERTRTSRQVISNAIIRGVLPSTFQITGLSQVESRELALLMRSGQLAAPLVPISERAIGPSLGQQNIEAGVKALLIGAGVLFLFMIFYYHLFGVVASVVLLGNVVMLTALLSMMKASLSLPGIAGILLTVGMAAPGVVTGKRLRSL